jgi:RHS repeat-associated protein
MRRPGLGVLGCLVGVGLIVGGVTPVWAAEGGASDGSALVGGFGLGDGLEGSVDEPSGAFRFALPAGGLNLGWDSRAMGSDLVGLGAGWSFGLARIQVEGGVRVFPASGGSYLANASEPSGLDGYTQADTRFEQAPGVLPADGARPEVAYSSSLHELGGSNTYFNDDGDPVAHVNAAGNRTDWRWEPDHRLVEVIDPDGVATSLEWSSSTLVVRPGSNLPGGGEAWVVELQNDQVVAAVDPEGGRTQVISDRSGLVLQVTGESGARTEVQWRAHDDGVARVDRVATFGADGAELSARTWQPAGAGALATGWPVVDAGMSSSSQGVAFATTVGDGQSELESTYNELGSLIKRVMTGTSPSGRQVLQEQSYEYPGTDEQGVPTLPVGELPKHWANPSAATVTFRDAAGGSRSGTQRTEFDEFGRLVTQTAADGVVTSYEYDPGEPGSVLPPVGLRTGERTVAPDGLVAEVRYELNDERTAAVAETGFAGREGGALVETGRVEYSVEDDGFVSERREFPAMTAELPAGDAEPRVARWGKEVDLAGGVMRLTETIGVGTGLEASTSSTVSLVHDGVLEQTDEVGNTMTAAYDRVGRVVSATDAAGRSVTSSYESVQQHGRNATTVTGPDLVSTTEVSDEFGRLLQVTDNIRDGAVEPGFARVVETREYPAPGQVQVTDAWGAVSSKRVDVFGRTVEAVAPTGLRSVTVHDDVAGTVTTGLGPTGDLADALATSTQVTDDGGRVTASTGTRADGVEVPEIGAVYDGFGRPVATTGGPIETATTYDAYGRPVEQKLEPTDDGQPAGGPESMSVSHTFDAYGTPSQRTVSDAAGSYSGGAQTFDALGRTTAETDQAGTTSTSTFTPDGLVESTNTTTGQQTNFEYHDTSRELIRSTTNSPDGAELASEFVHDPVTGRVTSVFDPADRAGTELSYTHDAFGNVLSVTYPDGKQLGYEYDEHGRRDAVIDTAGNTTRYEYDATGVPVAVTQTSPDGSELASVGYTYDAFGRLSEAARGNGVVTSYEYSAVNELTRETTTTAGIVTADRAYTYDAAGRLTARTDQITDPAGTAGGLQATTTTYTYDGFDRLTASTVHDGDTTAAPVTRSTRYVNTIAGDVERETVTTSPGAPDEVTTERVFEYAPAGELTAITTTTPDGTERAVQEYDDNGNLARDVDGTTYVYDAGNRVTEHTDAAGVTTRIGYWADGSRRHLTTGGSESEVSTAFYWDGETLVNDTHTDSQADPAVASGSVVTASYLVGTIRHARTLTTGTPGQSDPPVHDTSYLGTDRHGNTTDLTDEQGAVHTRYEYTDYGTTTAVDAANGVATVAGVSGAVGVASRNPFQYAASYADPSGSLHLDVRDYRPGTMRFDTPDQAKVLTNYAYGDLNPIMNVDPSGRSAIGDQVINGALAVFGLVAGIVAGVALGLPSGGMSLAATAWYVTAAVAIAGDFVSTGIAVAQIIDAAGPRFIRDEHREGLRISGIVIGTVAGFVSGAATYAYRARRAADAADAAAVVPAKVRDDLWSEVQVRKNVFEGKKKVQDVVESLSRKIKRNVAPFDDSASTKWLFDFGARLGNKKFPLLGNKKYSGLHGEKAKKLKTEEDWIKRWDDTITADEDMAKTATNNLQIYAEKAVVAYGQSAGTDQMFAAVRSLRSDLADAKSYITKLREDEINERAIDAVVADLLAQKGK